MDSKGKVFKLIWNKKEKQLRKNGIDCDIYALVLVICSLRSLLTIRPSTSQILAKGS